MLFKILVPIVLMLSSAIVSGEIIHACVANTDGAVRIVAEGVACDVDETAIEWGMVGVQGPAGPQGDIGPTGTQGPPGVGDIGCNTNQVAKWDDAGSQWVCADYPDVADLQNRITALETLLAGVTRNGNQLVFTGMNLQVVNGMGSTATINDLGNVIIGYNELRDFENARSGSHMLVVGSRNNYYQSYGGIVVGFQNGVYAPFASISGGEGNTARGDYSAVSGGANNEANGDFSSVSGGQNNRAFSLYSSVSGGASRGVDGNSDWRAGGLFEDN